VCVCGCKQVFLRRNTHTTILHTIHIFMLINRHRHKMTSHQAFKLLPNNRRRRRRGIQNGSSRCDDDDEPILSGYAKSSRPHPLLANEHRRRAEVRSHCSVVLLRMVDAAIVASFCCCFDGIMKPVCAVVLRNELN
jgi:hypothetical protein